MVPDIQGNFNIKSRFDLVCVFCKLIRKPGNIESFRVLINFSKTVFLIIFAVFNIF